MPAGGFKAGGGVVLNAQMQQREMTSITVPLPKGTGRRIRGQATIINGPLKTAGAVEFREFREE